MKANCIDPVDLFLMLRNRAKQERENRKIALAKQIRKLQNILCCEKNVNGGK